MKGNPSAVGNNLKKFGEAKKVEKGSDVLPRSTGHTGTESMNMSTKDFNRTKDTCSY